jgi:hypothetical protein
MGTVTAYDMASIQSALGGSNPIGLNEYYRGGSFVPTTASGTTREPATGQYFDYVSATPTGWSVIIASNGVIYVWFGNYPAPNAADGSTSVTSTDGWTYFRGSLVQTTGGKFASNDYGIFRTQTATVSINTGVPSSGTISIANLYGARNP